MTIERNLTGLLILGLRLILLWSLIFRSRLILGDRRRVRLLLLGTAIQRRDPAFERLHALHQRCNRPGQRIHPVVYLPAFIGIHRSRSLRTWREDATPMPEGMR